MGRETAVKDSILITSRETQPSLPHSCSVWVFGRRGAALQKPRSEAVCTANFHEEMWEELGSVAWRRQGWGWEMHLNLTICSKRWVIIDSHMMEDSLQLH